MILMIQCSSYSAHSKHDEISSEASQQIVLMTNSSRTFLKLSQKPRIDRNLFCDKNLFKLCFMLLDTSSSNNKTKTTLNDVLM